MKRIWIAALLLIGGTALAFGQKYAYVDTRYILSNVPEFEAAQKQIDDQAIAWQKEIEDKFAEIDALYKRYQNEAPLLTQDMKNRRENEIVQKEKEAKELQKKRFGNDGDLYKKREELIRPIQDKIYNAIEKKAKQRSYMFVFDRSDNANLLYADPKSDISNEVLKDMGYSPDDKKQQNSINVSSDSKPNTFSKSLSN
ncbi:MAG: OmpH family outer membrane protein [Bacteroidales bacterium]|nr:OmpH family outer membrane protein [Bacteroidales bacterium]